MENVLFLKLDLNIVGRVKDATNREVKWDRELKWLTTRSLGSFVQNALWCSAKRSRSVFGFSSTEGTSSWALNVLQVNCYCAWNECLSVCIMGRKEGKEQCYISCGWMGKYREKGSGLWSWKSGRGMASENWKGWGRKDVSDDEISFKMAKNVKDNMLKLETSGMRADCQRKSICTLNWKERVWEQR